MLYGSIWKTTPPALPALEVPRGLTAGTLQNLLSHSLVTVTWRAGSGKTTLMARLLAEIEQLRQQRGRPLVPVWYRLDPDDGDPVAFFRGLAAAVRDRLPGFAAPADPGPEPESIAAALRQGIAAFHPRELVLFLDDYHLLDPSSGTGRLLALLVDPPAANLHLCVAGERRLPLAALRLSSRLWELGPEDAPLSPAEATALLQGKYGLELSEAQLATLYRRTEGWAAGLHLMARWLEGRLRAGRPAGGELERELPESLADYFTSEVFARVDGDVRAFLLRTGILRRLEPAIIARYLKASASRAVLEDLADRNTFLSVRPSPEGPRYAYHPLFADFLRQKLARELPAGEVRELHRRAGDLWGEAEDMAEAAHHYGQAEAWDAMVDLCGRAGLREIGRGRGETVARCLERLPEGLEERDPRLLLCRGHLGGTFDPAPAIAALERAAGRFARRLDATGRAYALAQLGTIYGRQNRLRDLRRVARRLTPLPSGDHQLRGVLTVWACGRHAWEDRLDRGLWLARLAGRMALDEERRQLLAGHEGLLLCRRGLLDAAERAARRGLDSPAVRANDLWLADGYALLVHVLGLKGDHEAGLKLCDSLLRLADRHESAYHRAWSLRGLAWIYQREDRPDEAGRLFTESLEAFLEAGNQALAAVTRLELALLRVTGGAPPGPAYEEGRRACRQLRRHPGGMGLEDLGLCLLGCLAREAGHPGEAEELLLTAFRASQRKKAHQAATGTQLQLAQLYLAAGDRERARQHLADGFRRGAYHGYLSYAEWHAPTLFSLCLNALENGIEPAYAATLLGKWFAARAAPILRLTLASAPEESRQAAEGLLEEASHRDENVRFRLLGSFEVEAQGRPVPEAIWRTRKVRGILKYLIVRQGQAVSRGHLMELFWPNADQGAAAASLRVALSSLRQALQSAGMARAVVVNGETVRYVPAPGVWVDIHRFQEEAEAGLAAVKAKDAAAALDHLREARELYQGDLLPEDADEEWTLLPRQHLRQLREDVLVALADLLAERGDEAEAIDCCREVLVDNLFREDVYLRLMNLYRSQNRTSEAIQVYHQCLTQLRGHLGVDPGPPLQALFCELLG